jgi:hypothetical protein
MAAEELSGEPREPATIGERLVRARESVGLSLADIASQTRIPIRHLQNIEQEEWDALPAPTYAVGFVRAYAGAVGLDGASLGQELRQRLGAQVRRAPAPEYYEPADPARVPPRALAIAAALIAIVLIVGYALWRGSLGDDAGPAAPSSETRIPIAPAPSAAAPRPAPPAALAGRPVTLTATGEVWLKVTDGPDGTSLFQGTLTPGQAYAVPPGAQHPLLRTGRPQLLRVTAGARDLGPVEPTEHTVSGISLLAPDLAARAASAAAGPAPAPAGGPPAIAPAAAPSNIPLAPGAQPLDPTPGR